MYKEYTLEQVKKLPNFDANKVTFIVGRITHKDGDTHSVNLVNNVENYLVKITKQDWENHQKQREVARD